MPSKRPAKRVLLPADERESRLILRLIEDESMLSGVDSSDIIFRSVKEQLLPYNPFARSYIEAVYAGKDCVLSSMAAVFAWNTAGINHRVQEEKYRELLSFGIEAIADKRMIFDNGHPRIHHLLGKLDSIVGYQEQQAQLLRNATDNPLDGYLAASDAQYGRQLIELLASKTEHCQGTTLVRYLNQHFDKIGSLQVTSSALCDIFTVAAETKEASFKRDTPDLRRKWAEVLDSTTSGWEVVREGKAN